MNEESIEGKHLGHLKGHKLALHHDNEVHGAHRLHLKGSAIKHKALFRDIEEMYE